MDTLQKDSLKILDKHCSRCHQAGKTEGRYKERPAGRFGYVLDVDTMVQRGDIKVGLPNNSPIFNQITSGDMPKDKDESCDYSLEPDPKANCGPDDKEVKILQDWIKKLGEKPQKIERPFIAHKDIIGDMTRDLATITEFKRSQIRYFTLTNLYNAGDSDEDLKGYRMGLTKLLNSLSFASDPVKLVPVDEAETVFRVNIRELGWDENKWNALTKLDPYGLVYDDPSFKTLQDLTKTKLPFVRADWFTYTASQPPLYHDLLGLPKTKKELEKLVGVDVDKNIRELNVARAGFRHSGVSRHNRLIERHSSRMGVYWESYDFGGNADRQSFFKYPLGPRNVMGAVSEKHGFVHDGGEIIFELPNGFHAYYLTDHKGGRLDKGPTQIVSDKDRLDLAVTNGVSCMGCHSKGIKYNPSREASKMDQVRQYAKSTSELPLKLHEMIDAIYPKHDVFYKLMQSDGERYKNALAKAGVISGHTVNGAEVVNALFMRFEKNMDLKNAAAEFGMTVQQFDELANRNGGAVFALKQRLKHDAVPRDQFIQEFKSMVERITTNKLANPKKSGAVVTAKVNDVEYKAVAKITPPKNKAKKSKSFELIFYPDQHRFVKGKLVNFIVQSAKPCYLTLLNIPEKGKTTVIFPNKFHQDNRIDANISYKVPGNDIRGFKLRFGHTGKERVLAICNATRPDPLGITHNFSTRSFTTFDSEDVLLTRGLKKRRKTRQILVEDDSAKIEASKTEREKKMPALVKNDYDKRIDIEARKSVLLNVKAH